MSQPRACLDVLKCVNLALATQDEKIAWMREHLERLPPVAREELTTAMEQVLVACQKIEQHLTSATDRLKEHDTRAARRDLAAVDRLEAERQAGLTAMRRHDSFVEYHIDGLELPERHRRLLAECDFAIVCTEAGVSPLFQQFISDIGPEHYPDRWADIRANLGPMLAGKGIKSYSYEHMMVYTRGLVALQTAEGDERQRVPAGDLHPLRQALNVFYDAHVKPPSESADYAPGVLDVVGRLVTGAASANSLSEVQFDAMLADIDVFHARAARHEYSLKQVDTVLTAIGHVNLVLTGRRDAAQREMARLRFVIARYQSGPAHLEALDQQWRAYRVNRMLLAQQDRRRGALMPTTLEALKAAAAYCWSPMTVEAVASAAVGMPWRCALSVTALGDLAHSSTSGWWWFQRPVPIQTTVKSGEADPVVALLWRREHHPEQGPRVWISTFVIEIARLDGRDQAIAVPTMAWTWRDGLSLGALPADLEHGYQEIEYRAGYDGTTIEQTTQASVWFSRFFLAAAMWLRQRVVIPERGQGTRQVARQIQRQLALPETPTVQVVELRRQETATRVRVNGDADGSKREYSCRWVVNGFTRNQWYASRGEHAPRWIDSFIKGPADKPLKESARVYVVRR